MAKRKPPIERVGEDFRLNLEDEERELIQRLMAELQSMVSAADAPDARLRRLFPAAYHAESDRELDAEYQRLMRDELMTSRLKGLETVQTFLAADASSRRRLSEAQVLAFLQALNGVRLVLGTILDISEQDDVNDLADDHPMLGEYYLYDFLSGLLDWTVRALQR